MGFPTQRPRRLRNSATMRRMVKETRLHTDNLVMPIFVRPGKGLHQPIDAMPGIGRYSPDTAVDHARRIAEAGIPAVILFGIVDTKDSTGSAAWSAGGPVPTAVRLIKDQLPELTVICDVCLCAYTSHGHCGIVADGEILNMPTNRNLAKAACCYAEAGADIVAPSDMMDGRVGIIRQSLDDAGYQHVAIMSYAAKYASAYYGPFRDAACSAPSFGDRRTHQMDPANRREAIREIQLDIEEGADIIMIKPALAYLDVIADADRIGDRPIAAYNVSGEYSMVKAAAANGWIDEQAVVIETLTAIRRAGASIILTYHALDAAHWLKETHP